MLAIPHPLKIFLAVEPLDMRAQFDGLSAQAEQRLREDPRSGAVFAFTNKARNRVKLLYCNGTGVWLFAKRLEKGRFSWPVGSDSAKLALTAPALTMLLAGIDLKEGCKRRGTRADRRGAGMSPAFDYAVPALKQALAQNASL